ncbi:MAG: type II toxin-antitoxin system Phd/YefM family antitoxin [Gammaproteobacteria bacterium]|nr:MAG: type II toxin-antitoxin system Phd/YefM family antitoxin [Gammaproteobacteria bacterium]RLA44587.1 MAG: type II toxin-antitoxin system Phd/YefM family antitoxin [Gammaproteobacteria bacterium]
MTKIVNMHEAKTNLSALLALVEKGEEVVICRANKPVARLEPYKAPSVKRQLGEAKGQLEILPGFDDLPEEFMEHFQ